MKLQIDSIRSLFLKHGWDASYLEPILLLFESQEKFELARDVEMHLSAGWLSQAGIRQVLTRRYGQLPLRCEAVQTMEEYTLEQFGSIKDHLSGLLLENERYALEDDPLPFDKYLDCLGDCGYEERLKNFYPGLDGIEIDGLPLPSRLSLLAQQVALTLTEQLSVAGSDLHVLKGFLDLCAVCVPVSFDPQDGTLTVITG